MEKQSGGRKASVKPPQPPKSVPREKKVFGATALQLSDQEAFGLVGNIVEKGISGGRPVATSSSTPRLSVLPFPVARHRSHGPHWGPKVEESYEDDEEDNDMDAMNYDPIAAFANPIPKRKKKGLDMSNWRELLSSDSSDGHTKEMKGHAENQMANTEKMEVIYGESMSDNLSIASGIVNDAERRFPSEIEGDCREPMDLDQRIVPSSMANSNEDSLSMNFEGNAANAVDTFSFDESRRNGRFTSSQESMVYDRESSTPSRVDAAQKSNSVSLESQIDAENQARLQSMSPDEIAEAQEEIRGKLNPRLLNLLKQRGREKLGMGSSAKAISASSHETVLPARKDVEHSPVLDMSSSSSTMPASQQDTTRSLGENTIPVLSPDGGGLWDAWSKKVEDVRNLRFSLEGNVIQIESLHSTTSVAENGIAYGGYSDDNVAERDFLRTEGDPAAAGYTIKEALALTRSVIPAQRALALHLLSSVLNTALQNIHQHQTGHKVNNSDNNKNFVDWEAVWAFALGPEPELVLSLRLCLDDNHDSVVLACVKALQCILAYDWNEQFFDISDKLASQEKHLYTAPVFRSKPDIQGGFLHGGYWKYSAKPSNILAENIVSSKDGGEQTIHDDNYIAGQDIVAGFVRMGLLPRFRYILETTSTIELEECILSILIAIARHSPTCAYAVLKCERLVQTVRDRFMLTNRREVQGCQMKSVKLVRVLAQSDRRNCSEFVKNGTFENMMWQFYQDPLLARNKNSKISSQLMVEQLRLWKVCIKYGYCVSHFTCFYPAICFWMNPPTPEKHVQKDVLQDYASVAAEVYLVLGALAETLPSWNTGESSLHLSSDTCNDDTASWCWKNAASVVDIALDWIASDHGAPLYKIFDKEKGVESHFFSQGLAKSLLWVISAVLHMLSTIVKRATPVDSLNLKSDERGQLLLDLIAKIGLPLINSGFLNFTGSAILDHPSEENRGDCFIEKLCQFRHHTDQATSLASKSCLHGVLTLVASIDHLIGLSKQQVPAISFTGRELSKEETILDAGIFQCSYVEWKKVLCECMESFNSANHAVHNIEVFGRGGPAPGIGIGWGVAGGGFWSLDVVLVQEDARLLVDLLLVFQAHITGSEDKLIINQIINCTLAILLSVGPRDKVVAEKALEILLQIPILKHLSECLSAFLHNGQGGEVSLREYEDNDLLHLSCILTSHFRNRWLCKKRKKPKTQEEIRSFQHKPSGSTNSLATIHEDVDTSLEDIASLAMEWANQRLPLVSHWILSPMSTIGDLKQAGSLRTALIQDSVEVLEAAKAGIFFLSGIEAMSSTLQECDFSPVQSIPLVWKLHSLSVSLLSGMGVLEEDRTGDIFEALQRLYGHHLDELRLGARNKGYRNSNMNLLSFQSEIHESYSTFIETLVEQFAAVSYGDTTFGRQIAIYLHRSVEARTRLSAWNALSNSHVLELLPSLDNFIAEPEGYLEPLEDDESLLEAVLKSWVTGALDRAATRCSGTYTIAVHYLSSFIFDHDEVEKLPLRNKLVKSLLRDYSRKQQHERMMLNLLRYKYQPKAQMPRETEDQSLQGTLSRRFQILIDACEGNSSLLSIAGRLRSVCEN